MTIRLLLSGGDRRSIGKADEVVALVRRHRKLIGDVVECLSDTDPCVRMRAADVLEKVSRDAPQALQPFAGELIGHLREVTQKEVRWHLALLVPRLSLAGRECEDVSATLQEYLTDRSSIVKTFAMQGLADLTRQCPGLREQAGELIRSCVKTGTAAMRARGRILLKSFESES